MSKNKIKKKVKFWPIFLIIIASIVVINLFFNLSFGLGQYNYNMALWENDSQGLINHQYKYDQYKYGFGNVADNGCGSIAVYNILYLDGRDVAFPDVIKKISIYGLPLFGYLGTFPHAVIQTLNSYGYTAKITFDKDNFDTIASEHKYNIFCYISFEYGHYELAYDYDGSTFQFANPSFRGTLANEVEQTSECFFQALITVD